MRKSSLSKISYLTFFVFLLIVSTICVSSFAQSGLVFEENFDGTSVNTTEWKILNEADGSDAWYRPVNVAVSGGTLKLYNYEVLDNGKHWTGGAIVSIRQYPQYKYLESRVRHSASDTYIWATWWTVGWQNNAFKWPPEMDICEFQGAPGKDPGQWYHWDYAGSGHVWAGDDSGMEETQWHTYAAYWSATEACLFYVDGVLASGPVGPAEANLMGAELKLTSSPNNMNRFSGCALGTMEVDYVRVYNTPPTQTGTSHLALNKPITTSSAKNSGGAAKRAIDESTKTRWESNWYDPQWLTIDLQAICSVNQVKVMFQYSAARDYKIQVGDSSFGPWTDCTSITGNTTYDSYLTHSFTARTGRFLRFYGTARATPYGYSIKDLQVFGTVTNPNPPAPPTRSNMLLGKSATASSVQADYLGETFLATNVTDGSNTTRWATDWADPQWICVDLGSIQAVDTVAILWQDASAKDYKVQVSTVNGTSGPWTDCAVAAEGTYGLKIHEFTSINARYIRMYGTTRRTGYGYSMYEMQAYGTAGTGNNPPTVSITSPASGATYTAPATITINASASDSDGTVSKVEFYQGSTLLSTDTTSPYSYTWSSVPIGSYSLTAKVTDNGGIAVTSSAVAVVVNPAGALLSQGKPATASTVQDVNVATAANDGNIATRWGASSIAYPQWWRVDLGASYSLGDVVINWYSSFDRAMKYRIETSTDDSTYTTRVDKTANTTMGDTADSFSATARYVRITITGSTNTWAWASIIECKVYQSAGTNPPPTVSITAPANGATYTAPASVTINATASDSNGTVSSVAFYQGSTLLSTDTTSPYSYSWTNVAAGSYTLTARATDNGGAVTTSSPVNITVNGTANVPPTVSITAPANGATYTAPASVAITASASDSDGTIANVAFYQGATLLSTDTTSPYSYTWGSVAAGSYSLTARATDNGGAVTTSAAVGITVNAAGNTPPTVSITSPANGATFTAPASVTINATASDPGGSVANVAFYQGATLLSTDTTSPYSYTWGSVAAGTYSLTARATDNLGAVTTSAAIGITVNGGGGGTAPTYQAVGTVRSGTGTLTVSWPTHQANDVALLYVETANQAVTLSTPAGFAAVTNSPQSTGTAAATTATRLTVYWKRATTSAEASAVVADSGDHQIARIVTFRGVITSGNPWDVTAGNTGSASTSVSIPGATTTVANTLVAVIVANATDTTSSRTSAWTNSALTSLTERADNNTSSGNGGGAGVATGVKATAGAIGNTTATLATSSVQARMCIALKPTAGGGNVAPTVSITSPANGATFTAPASVTINANAADSDGTIANVAFYQGATLLSTDTTSPYSYTWGSVAAGTYSLTARATDNGGAVTTSAAIGITVNPAGNTPPTVSITAPANGATYTAPASVTINATASDPGGSVANVAFYQGATLLSTDTTSPYSYAWTNVAAGTYSLTARATDNLGAVTTSAAVGITVNSGGTPVLLSQGLSATASSFQTGNEVAKGNDGSSTTRWCANSGSYPQWWRVDLGSSRTLSRMDIEWLNPTSRYYQYRIETSTDDVTYTTRVDKTGNTTFGNTSDSFTTTARYVRVTVTGASGGYASAYEFKVYGN